MEKQNLGRGDQDALERTLTSLYPGAVPEGFEASWRMALRREAKTQRKAKFPSAFWKIALPGFAALVLIVGIALHGAWKPEAPPQMAQMAKIQSFSLESGESAMGDAVRFGGDITGGSIEEEGSAVLAEAVHSIDEGAFIAYAPYGLAILSVLLLYWLGRRLRRGI